MSIDPNMGFINPEPGQTPGPLYAEDINGGLTVIGAHDHSPGKGVQVTPSGLNINQDLPFNANSATGVKSVQFSSLNAALSVTTTLQVVGKELVYVDGAGNVVPITLNGSVNAGAGSITGLPSGTASASFSLGTFLWRQATNTGATMDMGSAVIREEVANGKGVTLSTISALGADYDLVLPTLPASTSFLTLDALGNITASVPVSGFGMPSGSIVAYGGTSAPTGWLLCDGTSYLRSLYPSLFSAIGTAYGAADGTHFNVPDFQGRFLRGTDNGTGRDPDTAGRTAMNAGGNTGDNVGSIETDSFQNHQHSVNDPGHVHDVLQQTGGGGALKAWLNTAFTTAALVTSVVNGLIQSHVTNLTVGNPSTGNVSTETRPINAYVNYIIKI